MPTVDVDVNVNVGDLRQALEASEKYSNALNEPITLWKLIEILKALEVIDAEFDESSIIDRLNNLHG